METRSDNMRDRLLARLPQPVNFAAYREETAAGLAKKERRLRWEKWFVRTFWVYVLGMWGIFLYRGEAWVETPHGHRWEVGMLVLFTLGAMQILKYVVLRSRVEILKEVKQVQLQVLELQASLQKDDGQ
jgi:hypothetical protein